jgi:NAD(P)-dependent dehydrogenase (short-subunit alcohol dehydrogenase family)
MKNTIFDLSGRVALVTGGSRGLGKAIAAGCAQAGADVVLASRDLDALKGVAAEIQQDADVRIECVAADLTKRDDAKRLAEASLGMMGKVDIVVNNAGQNHPQPIDQVEDEVWDRLMQLNLTSCMALTRALIPGMKERCWGRVINIASIFGIGGAVDRATYCATKAALMGMARSNAVDLGPFGVTVNCIAPGPFATEMPMSLFTQEQKDQFTVRTALGRWGQPEELVGAVLLLASDAGSYITGAVLVVDGGASIKQL